MEWSMLYVQDNPPSLSKIDEFIDNELWAEINTYLQNTYHVAPKLTYSKCSSQKGWNIKYAKSGKSLCTLYPMQGYFIALVVIGDKEEPETKLTLPLFSEYIQELYKKTAFSAGGRWLMINVTDRAILEDVKKLIQIRVNSKTK